MKLDNLTALRFFAAFAIFLHHAPRLGIDTHGALGGAPLGTGVTFFYVLSGFVLAYAYDGKTFDLNQSARFAAVRFFRLWPLHLVCTVPAIALLGWPDASTFYLYMTLQHTWVPTIETGFALNSVSWSISVELFFYLTFAVMLTMSLRQRHWFMLCWYAAVFTLLAIVSSGAFHLPVYSRDAARTAITDLSLVQFFPPIRILEFFAGVAAYHLFKRTRIPDQYVAVAQIGAIVGLVLIVKYHRLVKGMIWDHVPSQAMIHFNLVWLFPYFAVFIYVFAHQTGWVSKALSNRALVFLGDISFASYMTHNLIIFWLAKNGSFGLDPHSATLSAFALTVAASTALYLTVEKPSLRWAKRTFQERPSRRDNGPVLEAQPVRAVGPG